MAGAKRATAAYGVVVALVMWPLEGLSQTAPDHYFGFNTFGMPGMIDMPSATALPDATLATTLSHSPGSTRVTLSFQIAPRLTGSFRYARIAPWSARFPVLYDRSFDLHYLLFREGTYTPSVAIGLRDFIGTGTYSSEYIVASRQFTPQLRVSAGLGWGRLASRGGFSNPLGAISPSFLVRPRGFTGTGGVAEINRFFRGDAAPFAGVEYQVNDRLRLMVEYSSDAYVREVGAGLSWAPRTPINVGMSYQWSPGFAVSAYALQGATFGLSGVFTFNPRRMGGGSIRISAPAPVNRRVDDPGSRSESWAVAAEALTGPVTDGLRPIFEGEGLRLEGMHIEARRVVVRFTNTGHDTHARALGRAARVLSNAMPPSVEDFVLIPMVDGIAGPAVTIRRSDLEELEYHPDGGRELGRRMVVSDSLSFPGVGQLWQSLPEGRNNFEWWLAPYAQASIFDPDAPFRVDVGLRLRLRYNFSENLSADFALAQRVAGNIGDAVRRIGPRPAPYERVRSNTVFFYTARPAVERLTLDYRLRPGPDLYGRLSVGYFERMYAGVSAELLWSRPNSAVAFGVELNHLAQRDPNSTLGLGAYQVTSGHVSAYFDLGRGYTGQIDVGRYLAGDLGATFRLEREFSNGMRIGAFATFTDMPFSVFGEGSFDKGITLTIPLTTALGQMRRETSSAVVRPLTRDGGARLEVEGRLYDSIRDTRIRAMNRELETFLQ
jgi:hypothetical protein